MSARRIVSRGRCLGNWVVAVALVASGLVALGLSGCGRRGPAAAAAGRQIGKKDWTTAQGSILTSYLRIQKIDDESSGATVHVRHALKSKDQKPIEKLEMRFVQDNQPTEWIELPQTALIAEPGEGSDVVQAFATPFSAPTPIKIDFQATREGKPEEFTGWTVTLD